jgi:putative membrane protein
MRIAAAIILSLQATAAAAHDPVSLLPPAGPSPWDLGALMLLTVGGVLYGLGSWRLAHKGARIRLAERAAFWVGWVVMLPAIAPQTDRAAAAAFSAHMAQHEIMMFVGAPLMIVGRPIVPWLWAMPTAYRPSFARGLQHGAVTAVWRWLTLPLIAWTLHGLTVWAWHLPAFYEMALLDETIHALQHGTFVFTAVVFWWGLVYGRYGRAAYGASALFVFMTMVHTGVLGALFALSTAPYYDEYRVRAAAGGVDATTDQQLAGLYMWVPSGVILMLFGLALLVAWLSEAERRSTVTGSTAGLVVAPDRSAATATDHRIARDSEGGAPR